MEAICGWCGEHLGKEYKNKQLFCSEKCKLEFIKDAKLGEKE